MGVVWRRQMIPLHRRNDEGLFSMLDVEVEGWELHDKYHMGWRIMGDLLISIRINES